MPWDAQAQREATGLRNEAGDTSATLAARYNRAQQELGFGAGASNPYSQAAQLQKGFEANKRGITNTAGANLYAGSTVNAQSAARSQYDTGQKKLEDSYAEAQSAYNRGQARTQRDLAQGEAQIKEGAIGRAVASEPQPLAVGRGRRAGPPIIRERRNVRRPRQARQFNAQARAINRRVNRRARGRRF